MHTIRDISKHHGLKERFVRRCLEALNDVFTPHITRGKQNAILLDDSAFVIFDKIKQLKDKNLSTTEISKAIKETMGNTMEIKEKHSVNDGNQSGKLKAEENKDIPISDYVRELLEKNADLRVENERLNGQVKLLEYKQESVNSLANLTAKIDALTQSTSPQQAQVHKEDVGGGPSKEQEQGTTKQLNKKEKKEAKKKKKKK
jgi:hypothetical protein